MKKIRRANKSFNLAFRTKQKQPGAQQSKFTAAQITDWIDHPEKYDIQTDDDFAWMIAWSELVYDMNGIANKQSMKLKDLKNPTQQQIIMKVNDLRGRLVDEVQS
jgi:hypothetical protein